jgi:hypothetical protein
MSTATDSPRKDGSNINDFKHAAPIPILSSPHRRRPSISSSDGSPTSPPSVQTPNSPYPTSPAPSSPTSPSFLSYFMSTSPKTSSSFPYRRPPGFGAPPVFEGRSQSHPAVIERPTDDLDRPIADEDGQEVEVRNTSHHQRRATTGWAGTGRTPSSQRPAVPPPVIEEQHARGAGVLRRLSLGGGLNSVRTFDPNHGLSHLINIFLPQAFFQQGTANRPSSPPPPATPPPTAVTPSATSDFATNQNIPDVRTRVRRSATLSAPPRNRAPSPMGERILKGHFDSFN